MTNLIATIDKEASSLPLESQRQVLDFIGYLRAKNERKPDQAWLDRAWGAAPEFPDRPKEPPLFNMQAL